MYWAFAVLLMAKPAEVVAISTLVDGKLHEVGIIIFEVAAYTHHAIIIETIYRLTRLIPPVIKWQQVFSVIKTLTTKLIAIFCCRLLLAAYTLGTNNSYITLTINHT